MGKRRFFLGGAALVIILAFGLINIFSDKIDHTKDYEYLNYFKKHYKIFSLPTPDRLKFADEKIPLQLYDVKERFDKELLINTYWQSSTLLLSKRANRWFPVIEKILKENNVPEDFKYLAVAESGLLNVISPAGATGYWQFLKDTGKSYGLEVSKEVDERYHIEKSTEAACQYLKKAYDMYGSWTLAAASYNMGKDGVKRALESQQVDNYFDLHLNEETARYVFRILALKEIMSNPETYGFHIREKELYPPYKTKNIQIEESIEDLALWAKNQGTNYKVVKALNPWLRDQHLSVDEDKVYQIKLPVDNFSYPDKNTD